VDRHLVLNVDIAATVAGVAGVSAPAAEGTSVVPLLEGRPVGWRNDFLVEHEATPAVPPGPPTYCAVRSGRYLYVAYATGEEELYDLRADPFELVNRRDDPAMAAVLESRRARVRQLCRPPPPGLRLLGPP
jgi:arylsulfatase A-like enzyme